MYNHEWGYEEVGVDQGLDNSNYYSSHENLLTPTSHL